MLLQTVNNHPVHIINNDAKLSTTSFIPFCSFGDEFIGLRHKEFDLPVCDIFNPKYYSDQLCFETDIQKLKDIQKIEEQLKIGLTLLLDYNEERQINYNINESCSIKENYQNDSSSFSMFVDTISISLFFYRCDCSCKDAAQ